MVSDKLVKWGEIPRGERADPEVPVVSHWLVAYPFFSPALALFPPPVESRTIRGVRAVLRDADGFEVWSQRLPFPRLAPETVALSPFLDGLKLESGMKHGQLEVHGPSTVTSSLRLDGASSSALLGAPARVCDSQSAVYPVSFCDERVALIALLNSSRDTVMVRCKLHHEGGSEEIVRTLPPLGTRVLSVETDFGELEVRDRSIGYVRISVRGAAVQTYLLEQTRTTDGRHLYGSVG